MALNSLVLSCIVASLIAFAVADVPECVILLQAPHDRAHMWLQGAQSEAVRVYHSIFGGWLPTSCKPRAPRRRVPGCITPEHLCTHILIVAGELLPRDCQYKNCDFERFFPESETKPAEQWLEIAEGYLAHAWNVLEALHLGNCEGNSNYTFDEVLSHACAAEHIYGKVLKTLAPMSPWRDRKFSFKHVLSAPMIMSLFEADGLPEPLGDENDFVHKQRAVESYVTCCSIKHPHSKELLSVSLYVDPKARGVATSDQQLLWVVDTPVSDFPEDGPCAGMHSNIHDGTHTAYSEEFGYGDTVSVTLPETDVRFPGLDRRSYLHPDTAVLAETTDSFWTDDKSGQLINVVANEPLCPAAKRAFAFFSARTPGIGGAKMHANDDDDDDHLIARVVVRMRDEEADNCHDYDATTQVVVDQCAACTWPFEGFPIGPIRAQDEEAALCVGGVRHAEACDPSLTGNQQCTPTGACLKTKIDIFNGLTQFDEYVCFDWPKPGPNPTHPCKPNPFDCPYGVCYDGDGAYPGFGTQDNWYQSPDLSAVVVSTI